MSAPARLILVHKQRTSAMIRFVRFPHGIVAPDPLSKLAELMGEDEQVEEQAVVTPPAVLVKIVADLLDLSEDDIALEGGFRAHVDTPEGAAPVYLGSLTAIDPPYDAVERSGARFIAITDARDLPPTELELLRRAYECVME